MGAVGLQIHDLSRLTLDEFNAVYGEWDKIQTARYRTSWEQARFIAECIVAPYKKKGSGSRPIIEFDWEKPETKKPDARPATREDFERVRKRYGG